jgi:uncharacterized lipoprotein YbaY
MATFGVCMWVLQPWYIQSIADATKAPITATRIIHKNFVPIPWTEKQLRAEARKVIAARKRLDKKLGRTSTTESGKITKTKTQKKKRVVKVVSAKDE